MRRSSAVAVSVALLILSAVCSAQTLRGVISDSSGRRMPRAQVSLVGAMPHEQGLSLGSAVTGADGTFSLPMRRLPASILQPSYYLVAQSGRTAGVQPILNPEATQRIVIGPRTSISGTVTDSKGLPVPGVTFRPAVMESPAYFGRYALDYRAVEAVAPISPARTSASGAFTIDGLPSGWQLVEVFVQTPKGAVFTIQTPGAAQTVPPGSAYPPVRLVFDRLSAPVGGIDGRVVDPAGKPMRGLRVIAARLAAEGSSVTAPESRATTSQDGGFSFHGLLPGIYAVSVFESPKPVVPVTDVQVRADRTQSVTLRAVAGSTVEGRIVDGGTAKPVSGVVVGIPGTKAVTTGPDGRFSVAALPGPGVILALPSSPRYAAGQQELDVPANTRIGGITMKLRRNGVVAGRVLSPAAEGVDGALIRVMLADRPYGLVQADSRGRYRTGLSPETIGGLTVAGLVASDPQAKSGAIGAVRLQGVRDYKADIPLKPGASLDGTVTDVRGAAIPGARILPMLRYGRYSVPAFHAETWTSSSGRFLLTGLIPNAKYTLEITAPGYSPLRIDQQHMPSLTSGHTTSAVFKTQRP